ncbi:MAG TPA: CrcB family protein, partial [Acidimicrobiales bacterium]|nr:CrcB family protein [Acidimicrobiales bacterium]
SGSVIVPMRPTISLRPRQLALAAATVALGGAAGTLARDLALKVQSAPTADWTSRIPWVLLAANAVGVYLATWLLRGRLHHHDPNDVTRLLVITGLLGGFTSYSSLFVDVADVWHRSVAGGLAVAVGAVASGVAMAELGLRRGRRHHHRSPS